MIVDVDALVDYMSNIELSPDQRTAAKDILEGVQGEVETYLNRPIERVETTEIVFPDATGRIWMTNTPVVSVSAVSDGNAVALDAVDFVAQGNAIYSRAYAVAPYAITYVGGLDGANIKDIRLCVLRVASREMQNRHDSTHSVKGLVTKDVAPLPEGLQEEDKKRIERYRRRVIA